MPSQSVTDLSISKTELGLFDTLLSKVQELPWYSPLIALLMILSVKVYLQRSKELTEIERLQSEERKHLREMKIKAYEIRMQSKRDKQQRKSQPANGGSK
ncbi:hypothetical protein EU508_08300 [Pseudoalteromonas fuliginea]|uniref:Small integral membrane protein 15 n=1 Tax=Pseudoalteromonas fuliginea TaxID=1872678 RepID=A0AB73BHX7_9GAMM|nr:hypothetical protein [Pseudoalteromonas fuliginea]KAA1161005.1 hypothetical protein EU508_08300 [Pseudoalteromonas fuliginea]